MARRALTGNAADPKQGAYAERVVRRRRERLLGALRQELARPAGRLAFAEILETMRVDHDDTTYCEDHHAVYFRDGRRAARARLVESLQEADADLFDLLEREHRGQVKSEDREVEAVQQHMATEKAEEGET